MIRFIHTADIHFGVENYGKIDLATGIHSRLLDFSKALNFIIDVAIEENVDFFLFCGDAYKTHNPTQTQQKLFLESFLRLQKAEIPVVIIVGNHDHPLTFGKVHALDLFSQLPSGGFHVISKPKLLELETKSGKIQILGIPWPSKTTLSLSQNSFLEQSQSVASIVSAKVTAIIKKYAAEINPNFPAVLAGHLTVSNGIFSGSERSTLYGLDPIFFPSDLAISPFKYVALGHLHRHQELSNGNIPIVYSGSPEKIDFGERNDVKGFCLVKIEKNECTYEFLKTPTRDFLQIDIQLKPELDFTEQIINQISQISIKDAIVKIIYKVPQTISTAIDLQKIHRACFQAHVIAGILPQYTPLDRATRLHIQHTEQSLLSLMQLYFDNKPEFSLNKDQLLEKIVQIQQELEKTEEDVVTEKETMAQSVFAK